ncbi:MAG: siphovirus Gp157 family protein [Lachnospiraceae bacterium]|nr:siphovirus Gp157 family protein [Lachnospiraceae bacterium]
MSNTLFEIVGEFQQLYEIATEGTDPQLLDDTLEVLTADLEAKSAGYVAVMEQLKMEANKAEEIVKRYQAAKIARDNAIKRMKERLLIAMDTLGKKELPAGDFTIKVQKNGGKQPLTITGDVPESFSKVIVEPDNEKIRVALAKGEELGFAHLEERGRHVVIK